MNKIAAIELQVGQILQFGDGWRKSLDSIVRELAWACDLWPLTDKGTMCLLWWSANAVNQARVMRDSSLLQVPIVSGISQQCSQIMPITMSQDKAKSDPSFQNIFPLFWTIPWSSLRLRLTSTRFISWPTSRGNQQMQFDSSDTRSKLINLKNPFGNSFNDWYFILANHQDFVKIWTKKIEIGLC